MSDYGMVLEIAGLVTGATNPREPPPAPQPPPETRRAREEERRHADKDHK